VTLPSRVASFNPNNKKCLHNSKTFKIVQIWVMLPQEMEENALSHISLFSSRNKELGNASRCQMIKETCWVVQTVQFDRNHKHCHSAASCVVESSRVFRPWCWLSCTSSYSQVHTCSALNASCTSCASNNRVQKERKQRKTGILQTKMQPSFDVCFKTNTKLVTSASLRDKVRCSARQSTV